MDGRISGHSPSAAGTILIFLIYKRMTKDHIRFIIYLNHEK